MDVDVDAVLDAVEGVVVPLRVPSVERLQMCRRRRRGHGHCEDSKEAEEDGRPTVRRRRGSEERQNRGGEEGGRKGRRRLNREEGSGIDQCVPSGLGGDAGRGDGTALAGGRSRGR
jgi:hypothetical protein